LTVNKGIGARDHSWIIVKYRSNLDVRKEFVLERVVDRWNKLKQRNIDCGSISGFKNRLKRNQEGFFMDEFRQASRPHRNKETDPAVVTPDDQVNNDEYIASSHEHTCI